MYQDMYCTRVTYSTWLTVLVGHIIDIKVDIHIPNPYLEDGSQSECVRETHNSLSDNQVDFCPPSRVTRERVNVWTWTVFDSVGRIGRRHPQSKSAFLDKYRNHPSWQVYKQWAASVKKKKLEGTTPKWRYVHIQTTTSDETNSLNKGSKYNIAMTTSIPSHAWCTQHRFTLIRLFVA